jgi:hypothetical protein
MIVCKDWLKKYLGYYHPGYYVFIINGVLGTKIEVLENAIPLANDHHKKKHKKPPQKLDFLIDRMHRSNTPPSQVSEGRRNKRHHFGTLILRMISVGIVTFQKLNNVPFNLITYGRTAYSYTLK